jgi:TetR/AcrR family transcriptional regulator, tetracycline repressor protein
VPVPPRNPGRRPALTESEILDAALALLDAGGPEAATIRRIAAAVGAAPSTVYTYFPEQAAVGRALVERLLGEVGRATTGPARSTGPAESSGSTASGGAERSTWQDSVEALALAVRAQLIDHPGALPLVLAGPLTGPNALALGERLRQSMSRAGLTGEDADRGSYLVKVYVLGAAALDADLGAFRWGLRRVLAGLAAWKPPGGPN